VPYRPRGAGAGIVYRDGDHRQSGLIFRAPSVETGGKHCCAGGCSHGHQTWVALEKRCVRGADGPPKIAGELQCGGAAVVDLADPATASGTISPDHANGVLIGKRYADEVSGIEVLGAKAGAGSLAFDGRPLVLKEAKPLPASD
jgi:hypothetical protein